jgi:hypothetical protein
MGAAMTAFAEALVATAVAVAIGSLIGWVLVNVAIGCGAPGGDCWLAPWAEVTR